MPSFCRSASNKSWAWRHGNKARNEAVEVRNAKHAIISVHRKCVQFPASKIAVTSGNDPGEH